MNKSIPDLHDFKSTAASRLVYAFHSGGHRGAYLRFCESRFDLTPVFGQPSLTVIRRLMWVESLLFVTVSPRNAPWAVLIALFRSILGKRTTAICMSGKWYYDTQRRGRSMLTLQLSRVLHKLGRFDLFCIIPYQLRPEIRKTTSDWIIDLFLWNLPGARGDDGEEKQKMLDRVSAEAAGRKVLLYAGKASQRKRFGQLALQAGKLREKVLIVAAGSVSNECREDARYLEGLGMVVFDRYVSDEEMIALFKLADYVWCCYDEKQLSSGIFGLAVQLRRKAVVRKDSYLDQLAQFLRHPVCYELENELACEVKAKNKAGLATEPNNASARQRRLFDLEQRSVKKLEASLRLTANKH